MTTTVERLKQVISDKCADEGILAFHCTIMGKPTEEEMLREMLRFLEMDEKESKPVQWSDY